MNIRYSLGSLVRVVMKRKKRIINIPTLIIIIPKEAGTPCFNKSFNICNLGKKHFKYRYLLRCVCEALYII